MEQALFLSGVGLNPFFPKGDILQLEWSNIVKGSLDASVAVTEEAGQFNSLWERQQKRRQERELLLNKGGKRWKWSISGFGAKIFS